MKILRRISAFLIALLLMIPTYSVVTAASPASDVIRVGFFSFPGYHIVEENGRRSGYGYEFLQRLAIYGGWSYEYIGYDGSYSDSLDMLRRGEVDVVTSVTKTPEREEEFLFSDQPIGYNSTILTVKSGNQNIVEDDFASYNGITVGMLKNNSKNANFERFAKEHGFTFHAMYFNEQDELSAALQDGTVDAAVSGSLRLLDNEWLLESFDSNPFYICTGKDRPDLMKEINAAINEMDLHNPNWWKTLYESYYSTDQDGFIILNESERAFLEKLKESGKPLKLLFNPDRRPYCYFRDGQACGILPAVFDVLAQRLSLDYEFIPVESRDEYFALRESDAADVVLDFTSDYYLAENEDFKITSPYLQTNFARLTLSDFDGNVEKLAMAKRAEAIEEYITSRYPNDAIIQCESSKDCVEAVLNGQVDATILFSYASEWYVSEDIRNRLSSATFGSTSFSYAVSNNIEDNRYLLSILDKGAKSFTSAELDTIIAREIDAAQNNKNASLIAVLYQHPAYFVFGLTIILLLLFAIAMLVVRTNNQHKLEDKVAQATKDLEVKTQELSSALQAADAANRAKTTFLNSMSHDIRTPMNAIIGYIALTMTHLDNKEQVKDYLDKIAQASNHLLSLINDVLDMSRIESGKVTINEKPENLAEILQGLRNIIQSDIHAKRQELFIDTVDITEEGICCDKLRLNQILLNLTSNAIKFTPVGGTVEIRITQKPSQLPNHGIYEFRVSDNGIGMSPEFAKTVFEPFTREQTATVNGIQGTGLGMAITKNIVDMMGGTITVESEPDKGTTFAVTLELRFTDNQKQMKPITELNGLRGLVVDDDAVCCQSASKILRQIGMRSEWALSGREAVIRTSEAIEMDDPFEVYIVDWSMPEMSGIETIRQIRSIIGNNSPIILMSAYDWADIEQDARQAGATGFISKPLFASELHLTLERSLGHADEYPDAQAELHTEENFEGKRILLTEDNEINREIAAAILTEVGFAVECAENGQQACDMVSKSQSGWYDLILMDIQMPIMDGYAATRIIRNMENPDLANIPIIAMTANAFDEDREKALEAGMNGHLSKPIDVDKMMNVLHDLFNQKH